MKLHDIREMIKLVHQTSLEELEWEREGTRIAIKKAAPLPVQAEAPAVAEQPVAGMVNSSQEAAAATEVPGSADAQPKQAENGRPSAQTITSPTVGTFYASVRTGQEVKAGTLLGVCTVEALQLTEEVRSTADGIVTEILIADGELADYGRPLAIIQPK